MERLMRLGGGGNKVTASGIQESGENMFREYRLQRFPKEEFRTSMSTASEKPVLRYKTLRLVSSPSPLILPIEVCSVSNHLRRCRDVILPMPSGNKHGS
jgi:hypothetical protein